MWGNLHTYLIVTNCHVLFNLLLPVVPKTSFKPTSVPALVSSAGFTVPMYLCFTEDSMLSGCLTNRVGIPLSLAGHHGAAAQAAAAQAAAAAAVQAAALEQLREKLETGEPPEKKMMLMAEEQQRIMQHALQHNLFAMATQLPMNIKLNNRGVCACVGEGVYLCTERIIYISSIPARL